MPKIYRANSPLRKNVLKYSFLIGLVWFTTLILLSIMDSLEILPYYGLFVLSSSFLFSAFLGRKIRISLKGIRGENYTINLMKKLPEGFDVYTNVPIIHQGKESENDLIIVSHNGVFLVEVKNHLGYITGNESDKKWIQYKKTDNGGKYNNPFYNPIKQVKTHIFKLSQVLKQNNFDGWVQGIVFFSNPEVRLKIQSSNRIPTFSSEEKLIDFIVNFKPKRKITDTDISNIKKAIEKQIKMNKKNSYFFSKKEKSTVG